MVLVLVNAPGVADVPPLTLNDVVIVVLLTVLALLIALANVIALYVVAVEVFHPAYKVTLAEGAKVELAAWFVPVALPSCQPLNV